VSDIVAEVSLNVILLSGIYPPASGGPAVFTARYYKWLKTIGVQTKVITYSNSNAPSNDVLMIPSRNSKIVKFIFFVLTLIKNTNRHSVVLANGCFLEVFFFGLLTGRKYVLKIPGDPLWEKSRNLGWTTATIEDFQNQRLHWRQQFLRILYNGSIKNASYIIAPSSQLAKLSIQWGANPENVHIIYNCVDPKVFRSDARLVKTNDLITICRLVPWKGLHELILVASKSNLSLTIVGSGPILQELIDLSNKSKARVKFIGDVQNSEIVEYLLKSRVFVLNSEFEATAYSLLEAKMLGIPVVAKKSGGSAEVINQGIDGFLYSPGEKLDLKDCISELIGNPIKAEEIARQGRIDALDRFNQDINFPKILKVLKSIHG
jgi:glycosyltransferase involved in cell wall biosynthesis